jgi:hypothetical protein
MSIMSTKAGTHGISKVGKGAKNRYISIQSQTILPRLYSSQLIILGPI